MTKLLTTAAVAVLMLSSPAWAFLDDNDVNDNDLIQNQAQQQGQGQAQGQQQKQANSQTTKFDDERQLAPVSVTTPSFGASVGSGYMNSCAGTEAWSVGIGGAFFVPNGTGAPITAGVGYGEQELAVLNLCEVRETAHAVSITLGQSPVTAEITHNIMCMSPLYRQAAEQTGRTCPTYAPIKMEVAIGEVQEPEKAAQVASAGGVSANAGGTCYYSSGGC